MKVQPCAKGMPHHQKKIDMHSGAPDLQRQGGTQLNITKRLQHLDGFF
jgi:hypothetical protein